MSDFDLLGLVQVQVSIDRPSHKRILAGAVDEIDSLRQQLNQAQADVARLREAAYPLYTWCAEHLSIDQFRDAYEIGHALGLILESDKPSVGAFIKLKQAEALKSCAEVAGKMTADHPWQIVTMMLDEAQRLRGEADNER